MTLLKKIDRYDNIALLSSVFSRRTHGRADADIRAAARQRGGGQRVPHACGFHVRPHRAHGTCQSVRLSLGNDHHDFLTVSSFTWWCAVFLFYFCSRVQVNVVCMKS